MPYISTTFRRGTRLRREFAADPPHCCRPACRGRGGDLAYRRRGCGGADSLGEIGADGPISCDFTAMSCSTVAMRQTAELRCFFTN